MAGDEFYDDGVTSGPTLGDYRAAADLRLAELRNASACSSCGSLEPVRLEGERCSSCSDFPRCIGCDCWVGDGSNWLPGYVNVLDENGQDARLCEPCWEGIG